MSFTRITWDMQSRDITLGTFLELIEPGTRVVRYPFGERLQEYKLADAGVMNRRHFRCTRKDCDGWRVSVRWPSGRHTYPCTNSMEYANGKWWIR